MDRNNQPQLLVAAVSRIVRERDGELRELEVIPNERLRLLNEQVKRTLSLESGLQRVAVGRDEAIGGEVTTIPLQKSLSLSCALDASYGRPLMTRFRVMFSTLAQLLELPRQRRAVAAVVAMIGATILLTLPHDRLRLSKNHPMQSRSHLLGDTAAFKKPFLPRSNAPDLSVFIAYEFDENIAISLRSFLSDSGRYAAASDEVRIRLDLPVQQLLVDRGLVRIP